MGVWVFHSHTPILPYSHTRSQQGAEARQFLLAAEEAGELREEVARIGPFQRERRERLLRGLRIRNLEDPHGRFSGGQAVETEIRQPDTRSQCSAGIPRQKNGGLLRT